MGSIMGNVMEENLKKSQTFMFETQKMQMERQLQMQKMMRERQMAMQVAGSREMFNWLVSFYGLAMLAMTAGYMMTTCFGVPGQGMTASAIGIRFVRRSVDRTSSGHAKNSTGCLLK